MQNERILNGEITGVPDLLKLSLSAFSISVEPGEALPTHFDADTDYYDKQLAEDSRELAEVIAWTDEEADDAARRANLRIVKLRIEMVRSKRQVARTVGPLLTQLEAWQPPTPIHEALKEHAKTRLLEWDGKAPEEINYDDPSLPNPDYTGKSYRESQRTTLIQRIARSEERRSVAITESEESTAWVQALSASFDAWQPVEVPTRQLP